MHIQPGIQKWVEDDGSVVDTKPAFTLLFINVDIIERIDDDVSPTIITAPHGEPQTQG